MVRPVPLLPAGAERAAAPAALAPNVIIGGKWQLGKKIGSGAFGDIHVCYHVASGEEVAAKLESIKCKHPQLAYEYKLYKLLLQGGGSIGMPNVQWFGREGDYHVMIMDLMGQSLEDLFNFCGRKFSLKTVSIS